MAKLPPVLRFLRPLIHRTRIILLKALGLSELRNLVGTRGGVNSPIDLLLVRLSDRLSLLESQVNWRLYGLPARVCNIKLEQAQLLAGAGDVERALEALSARLTGEQISTAVLPKLSGDSRVFVVLGREWTTLKELLNSSQMVLIHDANDLFFETDKNLYSHISGTSEVLEVGAVNSMARLQQPEFDLIWFSSLFERVTPLQMEVALSRACGALRPGACCSGFFVDYSKTDTGEYWADPRRLRPLTRTAFEIFARAAGFEKIEFAEGERKDLCYFKCIKT